MEHLDNIDKNFREALVDVIPCSVFMVDKHHKIIYWNKSAEQLTGYDASEIVGATCDKLKLSICSYQDISIRETFCPLISGGNGGEVECELLTKDDSLIPVMRRSRPVFDDNGNIIGAIEALIDVSLIKQARNEIRNLKHEIARMGKYGQLVGSSHKMQNLYELIQVVSKNDAGILIEGETGTGKELIAKTIHAESNRAKNTFLAVNCGALPESLLEAELFGHRKGSFTGAIEDRAGCFETASGGTLFLDEIGEMPLLSQVKLLRVLQEKEITRIGEAFPRAVDCRIIAAANKKIPDLIQSGKFREDLYYRLRVVGLAVPPLREHKEDIKDLISHFIGQFNREYNKNIEGCTPSVMNLLLSYKWPGNIRELEHVIEHSFAVTTSSQKVINLSSLPPELTRDNQSIRALKRTRKPITTKNEKTQVETALAESNGNKAQAARILGITRAGLYKKMRRLGM